MFSSCQSLTQALLKNKMQRKIDQYWKKKDNIKETVSAVASKVRRTVSDFGAQTSTISGHQSTQQEQADSILFQEASSIN